VPAGMEDAYAERIARLPRSFQVNDARRADAGPALTRAAVGLPEHATVLACFNAIYKIGPAMFDVWMRVLAQAPHAVLWLVAEHPQARRRMRDEAARHGVDPARLVLAPRAPYAEYLARLRLADLFVDTLPFNAGTTASDALWMGVPLLTCAGEAFAARMAGSLLHACGLGELVTHDLATYEARAVALARDGATLRDLRARVARVRADAPLFDTDRVGRSIEDAYLQMALRARRGEGPAPIHVGPPA
jgi:protein O-GlcNAc transferase